MFIHEVFAANGGLASREQLLATMNPKTLARHVAAGAIVRVWHGVYALVEPDLPGRLAALELSTGRPVVAWSRRESCCRWQTPVLSRRWKAWPAW